MFAGFSFRLDGDLSFWLSRKHLILPTGPIRGSVFYGITDDDWAEAKSKLQTKLVQAELAPGL
jgi:hypothetical protein